jgi:hypothetical protein
MRLIPRMITAHAHVLRQFGEQLFTVQPVGTIVASLPNCVTL